MLAVVAGAEIEPTIDYSDLDMHRTMLRDRPRCEAFRRALEQVVRPGDVVLDVGAGSGILSFFAAKAGAAKVYAVERAPVAALARRLAEANGLAARIEVLETDVDSVELPGDVDVIVSEWLGTFGINENFLQPVVAARDRWLKSGGAMVPAEVTTWAALAWDTEVGEVLDFFASAPYGLDLGPIARQSHDELFCLRGKLLPEDLRSLPVALWTTDAYTVAAEEAVGPFEAEARLDVVEAGTANALALWFVAELAPAVVLGSGPGDPPTHWGRMICPLREPLALEPGTDVAVRVRTEPGTSGWTWTQWAVRIGEGAWQEHDQRRSAGFSGA
jgi:protein arginine N-methyltransferase 1